MKKINEAAVITSKQFNRMCAAVPFDDKDPFEFVDSVNDNGSQYHIWKDVRNGRKYAVKQIKTVHFGLNSIPQEKVDEFIAIVEREGSCQASWGCTGRTLHLSLAQQLKKMLPQYEFELGYNYKCIANKRGKED